MSRALQPGVDGDLKGHVKGRCERRCERPAARRRPLWPAYRKPPLVGRLPGTGGGDPRPVVEPPTPRMKAVPDTRDDVPTRYGPPRDRSMALLYSDRPDLRHALPPPTVLPDPGSRRLRGFAAGADGWLSALCRRGTFRPGGGVQDRCVCRWGTHRTRRADSAPDSQLDDPLPLRPVPLPQQTDKRTGDGGSCLADVCLRGTRHRAHGGRTRHTAYGTRRTHTAHGRTPRCALPRRPAQAR